MAVSGQIGGSISVRDDRSISLSTKDVGPALSFALNLTDGSGAGQANKIYAVERILPGASEDLDLNGVLTDALGATLSVTRIVAIAIVNVSTANTITIGNATSNAWATLLNSTGTLTLRPSTASSKSFVLIAAADATGYVVTASTGDILKVAGTSGQSYQILFFGS